MRIQVFIFSWQKVQDNVRDLVKYFENHNFENILVISSGPHIYKYDRAQLVEISESAFYGDQFREAAVRFNGDVMLQVQGDIEIKSTIDIHERIEYIFHDTSISIWAPYINFTSWNDYVVGFKTIDNPYFKQIHKTQFNLLDILNPDSTFWAIRRNIIEEYLKLSITKSFFGWGIDLTLAAIAFLKKERVVRDHKVKIRHPRGTGYNQSKAISEWLQMYQELPLNIQVIISFLSIQLFEKSRKYNKKIYVRIINLLYCLKSFSKIIKN